MADQITSGRKYQLCIDFKIEIKGVAKWQSFLYAVTQEHSNSKMRDPFFVKENSLVARVAVYEVEARAAE